MIKLADGRGSLYQWDTGRQVECDAEQVHFSNHHYGTSIDVDVKDGKATIPNQLLTSATPIKAWAWVTDINGEYTKEEQIFIVAKRNKPSDYVYTPTEIKTWQDLQNQIGDLNNLTTAHKDNLVNAINDAAGGGGASTAEDVSYTNAALPNISTVGGALDELVPKSHTHSNKDTLDKLSDSNGKLQYNGSDVGLKGDKGDKGDTGAAFTYSDFTAEQLAALKGAPGDTGAAGADGKSAYQIALDNGFVGSQSEWLASLKGEPGTVQLTPLFANDISECTDTTKLYVLPDGFVYAYMKKTQQGEVTERITGEFLDDTRLATAEDATRPLAGFVSTPYIDISQYSDGFTVKLSGIAWCNDGTSSTTGYSYNFIPVDGGTFRGGYIVNVNALTNFGYQITCDTTTKEVTITTTSKFKEKYNKIRFSGKGTSSNAVVNITHTTIVNEEGWYSTGHAFVPADYEDRIIQNETDISALENRVSVLESGGTVDGIKSYVQEEAERVAKTVYSKQNANTFTFLAIADMHYHTNYPQISTSNIHAGQGMDLVRKGVNVDFAVCLGDNGWGSGVVNDTNRATIEIGLAEIRKANQCIDSAFRGVPNFRTPGNHDSLIYNYTFNGNDYLDSSELFPLYGAYNRGAVFQNAEKERGYCYRDFDDWKLRVICVNTSDIKDLTHSDSTPDVYVSGTQGQWFAKSLDLSAKENADEWNILILSHAPLDWGVNCIYLCDILKAYIEGSSVSVIRDGVTISYDYSGKNSATVIGNCHGHNHNFKTDNLRRLITGTATTEPISVKRFCIPNACFTRTNEKGENDTTDILDIEYGEETSYEKVANTAQDTAFCVVTVDVVARKIYAGCYGAGYDREISY